MLTKMITRLTAFAGLFLLGGLLNSPQLITVASTQPISSANPQELECPVHASTHGRLFLEPWDSLNNEENPHGWGAYLAQVSSATVNSAQITPWAEAPLTNWLVGSHILNQTNTNTQHLNLLFESVAEVGDGIIETCIRLPQLPPTASVFPHGVAFRIQHNSQNQTVSGFAVGFVNDNTLALGQVVENEATRLGLAPVGWSATQWTKLKIELSGNTMRVYAALEGTEYPLNPVLTTTSGTATSQGLVGFATYGITGEFSPITVDFTCSGVLLNPIEQAMFNRFATTYTIGQSLYKTPYPYFCGNDVEPLIVVERTDLGDTRPAEVYNQLAELMEQAKYEIQLTSLI